MHIHKNGSDTCFYLFFHLREGIDAKLLWPKKFSPKLRKSCKQN